MTTNIFFIVVAIAFGIISSMFIEWIGYSVRYDYSHPWISLAEGVEIL